MNQKTLLILGLLIPSVIFAYQFYRYTETKICEDVETGYEIVDTKVYFNARIGNNEQCSVVKIELKEADADTFVDLGFKIAKDKNNVYDASFKGYSIVNGVDVNSYFVFDRSYRKDSNNVYWYEEVIPYADPASFEVIGEHSLAKDENSLYQFGHAIQGADETSFKILNWQVPRILDT